jgi:hypothetical protein
MNDRKNHYGIGANNKENAIGKPSSENTMNGRIYANTWKGFGIFYRPPDGRLHFRDKLNAQAGFAIVIPQGGISEVGLSFWPNDEPPLHPFG